MKLRTLLAAAALVLAAAPTAQAASWKLVTAPGGGSTDQVSAVRTADGVLHVAWRQQGDNLFHTTISADGKVGATTPIVTGWADALDPALTVVPGGLRAFWGGIRTTESTEPNRDTNTALSTDGGATWALQTGSINPGDAQSYASDTSAATLTNGTTLQAWFGTLGTWVHAGLDPATPNFNYQAPLGSYGNFPGIAADSAGGAMLAWFSSAAGHIGVLAQAVGGNGAPAGPVMTMPNTSTMVGSGTVTRTPIAARAKHGGYFVTYGTGYPSSKFVRVWKVGAAKSTLLSTAEANSQTSVAADPKGRIWAIWSDGTFGDKRVLAARSNLAATEFGAPVDVGAAKNANSVYSLDASATSGALDVLALFGVGTESGGSTYVTRVSPGLTVTAKRHEHTVTLTVTDAGDPVKGATVRGNGRSDKTDGRGHATLPYRAKSTVTASAKGYEDAAVKLK